MLSFSVLNQQFAIPAVVDDDLDAAVDAVAGCEAADWEDDVVESADAAGMDVVELAVAAGWDDVVELAVVDAGNDAVVGADLDVR